MGHANGTSIWLGATAFDTQPVHRKAARRYDGHFEESGDMEGAGIPQAIALPTKAATPKIRNLHLPYEILEYIVQQVADIPTLLSLCRSSRALHNICIRHLYRNISVRGHLSEADRWTFVSPPSSSQSKLLDTIGTSPLGCQRGGGTDLPHVSGVQRYVRKLQLRYVDTWKPEDPGFPFVTALVERATQLIKNCERIEDLQICAKVALRPSLIEAILSLKKLKNLVVNFDDNGYDVASLAHLPSLTSFQVSFENTERLWYPIPDSYHLVRKILQTSSKTLNALHFRGSRNKRPEVNANTWEEMGQLIFGGARDRQYDSKLARTAPWETITRFENLERLVLHAFDFGPESIFLIPLAIDFSKLTYLELINCDNAAEVICLDVEWTSLKKVCLEAQDPRAVKTFLQNTSGLQEIFFIDLVCDAPSLTISDLVGLICERHGDTLQSLALKPKALGSPESGFLSGFDFIKLARGSKHLRELRIAYSFTDWYDLVHAIHLLLKLEVLYFENPVLEAIPLFNYSLSHHGFRYSSTDRPLSLPSSYPTSPSFSYSSCTSYSSLLFSPSCPSQRACERGIASIIKNYLKHYPGKPPPIREVSMIRGGDKKRRWYYDIGPGILSESWGSVDGWIGFYCDRAGKSWKSSMKGPWRMENGSGESVGNLVEF